MRVRHCPSHRCRTIRNFRNSDGRMKQTFQEHPQGMLLTLSLFPVLQKLHPDGQFILGANSGIYWRETDPPLRGCLAPDWFYVPGVPPMLEGEVRRSYVLWQEMIPPLIVMEFASGDGSEERDRTPEEGKFWIYERRIRPAYYAIYEFDPGRVEVYQMVGWNFQPLPTNEHGRYPIAPLGIELGIWEGTYLGVQLPWLRCWDSKGQLLLTGREIAEAERQRAEAERQLAERMAVQLRELGINPEEI